MANNYFKRNERLLKWATKIDSSIHHKHEDELRSLRIMNKFQSAFGSEECIPVGSCVEGSKVNIPGDIGDIDVLLVSDKVILKEELFEYVPGYPAFLCIPVIEEHSQYFGKVNLIDGIYLPVCILKDIHSNLFQQIKFIVSIKSSPKITKKELRYIKESAVGIEVRVLEGIGLSELEIHCEEQDNTFSDALCEIGNAFDGILDTIADATSGEPDNKMLDFTVPEYNKMDVIRQTNMGENIGSSLYNVFVSIQDKYKHINKKERKIEPDILHKDQADERTVDKSTDGTEDDRAIDSAFLPKPLSEVRLSQFDEDEWHIKFENDLERASKLEEAVSVKNNKTINVEPGLNYATKDDPGIPLEFSNILSIDFVPALMVDRWPKVAKEWITRKRKWPTMKVIDIILKTGCQVVVKHLPHRTIKENQRHFRLSFAISEIILAKSLNDNQKLVWRILKAYQKAYLCSEPKVLSSYHWKNVIFWICERETDDFWRTSNVLNTVNESLDFMIDCLTEKFLPQYFIRDMNLIIDCDSETIELVKQTLISIREEPERQLQMFIRNPPLQRTCFISQDELKQVRENNKKKDTEKRVGDLITMFTGWTKTMSDEEHEMKNKCRFVEGASGFASELKSVFMEDQIRKGRIEDPETNVISQFLDMMGQITETFDPRKDEIDTSKHLTNFSNVIGGLGAVFLNRAMGKQSKKSHTKNSHNKK